MFSRFSRVRLILRDDADDPVEGARVLVRQRTSWVMLLAAYLALFCLPAHRSFISDQAVRALARKSPAWMSAAMGESSDAQKQLSATAQKSPEERDLQLGAVHLRATPTQMSAGPAVPAVQGGFEDPRLVAVDALRAQFPDDPAPIAHVVRLFWLRSGLRRKGLDNASHGRELSPNDVARLEALCREGARLDPENGYFPTMLAVAQFGGMRDDEALQSLHAASVCSTWKDYAAHQGTGARDLLIRTFGDRGVMMHALPSASILLPHFFPIRQSAQLAAAEAAAARASGNLQLEHRTRTDLIRLGSLMRRTGDILIGRLVGAAVEDLGFGARPHAEGWRAANREAKAAERRDAYAAAIRSEAPSLAAEVDHELQSLNRFLEVRRWYVADSAPFKSWDQIIQSEVQRDVLGMMLLPNLAATLLGWLIAASAIIVFRPRAIRAGERADQLRAWSPWSIALVLCVAAVVCTGVARSVNLGHCWSAMLPAFWLLGGDQTGQPVPVIGGLLCNGALASLTILAAVLVVAVARRRTLRETLDGVRLAFKSAAAIAAGLYLVYALVSVPATARDAQTWERSMAREMRGQPL